MAVTINGDGLVDVGGTSTSQGRVRLAEDTDNGTNYIELTAPASVASNKTITFPDETGTVVTSASTPVVLISTQTASSSTTIDFTSGVTGYSDYRIEFDNVVPATSSSTFQLQMSENAGSSWMTGASDYASQYLRHGGSSYTESGTVSTTSSAINMQDAVQNTSTWGISGTIELHGLSSANKKIVIFRTGGLLADNYLWSSEGSGAAVNSSNAVNGLRLKFGSGNISSGTFRLYGIR